MKIEQFVAQSLGEWRSMRSSHSLAFKQFEDIVSYIKISQIEVSNIKVRELVSKTTYSEKDIISPFKVTWAADTNWGEGEKANDMKGSTLLIPVIAKKKEGVMLRSIGYTEKIMALSKYKFVCDGTLILTTEYSESVAEERIWFISDNVRCRSSIVRSHKGSAILQASFSSELRYKNG